MLSLTNKQLKVNGNLYTFEQDPNKQQFIKINQISLGETPKFSYKTLKTPDIGQLLDNSLSDPQIACIIYDWTTGTGYLRSGFNVNNLNDIKVNTNTTTFINKNVISQFYPITPGKPSIPLKPLPITQPQSNFVTINNGNFTLNNKNWYPVGINAYFLGLMEDYTYPSHQIIEEMFQHAQTLSCNIIRSHTLGFSSGSSVSLLTNNNTINDNAWDPIDYAYYMAEKYNIKLFVPLTDNYWYYHGNYNDYNIKYNLQKHQFWTDQRPRNDFKNYIKTYLTHINKYTGKAIRDSPALFAIELGNELGNDRGNDTTQPPKEWIQDICKYIKTIDTNHLICSGTDECLGSQISDDFNIPEVDFYSSHYYSMDYNRLNNSVQQSKNKSKPHIVGEYSSKFDQSWYDYLYNNRIPGVMWSLYPNGIYHDDGFSLNMNTPGDKWYLDIISNYNKKMKEL